jgi:hypothetical protein
LHPNRCIASRDPKTIAFVGTDDNELNGGAGLNTPVLASGENEGGSRWFDERREAVNNKAVNNKASILVGEKLT